jgi:hypothetical protein
MELNPKDPKTLTAAVLVIAGALGAGSMLGLTIEPEETTALRVENAMLTERTTNLEEQSEALERRVMVLERIVEGCRAVVDACRNQPTPGGTTP